MAGTSKGCGRLQDRCWVSCCQPVRASHAQIGVRFGMFFDVISSHASNFVQEEHEFEDSGSECLPWYPSLGDPHPCPRGVPSPPTLPSPPRPYGEGSKSKRRRRGL